MFLGPNHPSKREVFLNFDWGENSLDLPPMRTRTSAPQRNYSSNRRPRNFGQRQPQIQVQQMHQPVQPQMQPRPHLKLSTFARSLSMCT